jgi:Zn finger protein HypA/HybF involved in hydrogenase expression
MSESLKVICAWCKAYLRGPASAPDNEVSHGICPACLERERAKLRQGEELGLAE